MLFIVLALLVFIDVAKKKEAKKSAESSEIKRITPLRDTSQVITVDRRIIYQVPGKCPECGSILSNEDVDWVGPLRAKCPFCCTMVEVQPAEF